MNKKQVFIPLLILAAGIGGFAALKASRPKPPLVQVKEPVWRVHALPVQLVTARPTVMLNGRVESPDQTQAAAPGPGRVLVVRVREGEAIRRGQTLLELDPRDFQPKVEQARGQVQELEAAIASENLRHQADVDQLARERQLQDFAAADLARFERLQRENFYSQAAVDQSRSNLSRQAIGVRTRELAIADHRARLAQLDARLLQARANLQQVELALQRSRVSAPYDGYVAQVAVAAGDQVNTGQMLLRLYPAAGLEVRAKLPAPLQASFLAALSRTEGGQVFARVGGQPLGMRLSRVAAAADARGLDAFFTLDTPVTTWRLGEMVNLEVARSAEQGVVAMPYEALFGGNRVYRIVAGRLQGVEVVSLGEAAGAPGKLLVRGAALQNGDQLMVTHLSHAVTGLKVDVINAVAH